MIGQITFDVLPLVVLRGSLVCTGNAVRVVIDGVNCWDAVEKAYISVGFSYSARRTVANYNPPYAVLQRGEEWKALYYIEPTLLDVDTATRQDIEGRV